MYASALKFCGAMEVCGLGFPQGMPIDFQWPDVIAQAKAQRAGMLICYTRAHKPAEAEFMEAKGFIPASPTFENPRTGSVCQMWIKDLTGQTGLRA